MTTPPTLLRHVRPMGGEAVDVLVRDGDIATVGPDLTPPDADTVVRDGAGELLLPGLVNAHAHIDKTLLGLPWQPNGVPGGRIRDFADHERRVWRELGLSSERQSALALRASIAAGVTHLRSHVDIDVGAGLAHFEGVLANRERFRDAVTLQLVAFPQSGMLVRPGTLDLLEAALALGADCLGGLDPSTVDRDPVGHLDALFALAERFGVELDIHLHEPGALGAFSVELILERVAALSLQGRVTISHAFCLGGVDDATLERLIEGLVACDVAIMSLGSGRGVFPPLARLHEAGVRLCTGSDGVRDSWGPYNGVDMLERTMLLGYRSGFRRDDQIGVLLEIATEGGARVMGAERYGLAPGCRADLVLLPGDTPAHAVVERPPRTLVLKGGRVVAERGALAPDVP